MDMDDPTVAQLFCMLTVLVIFVARKSDTACGMKLFEHLPRWRNGRRAGLKHQ